MNLHHVPDPDAPTAPTPPPSRADAAETRTPPPVMTVCDLGQANVFDGTSKPNAPVLTAFAGDRLHQFESRGWWDLERAVADAPADTLFRSILRTNPERNFRQWDDLTFRHGPRLDAAEASRLAERLGRRLPSAGGDFSLAEVFAGGEPESPQRARMGFAA